MWWEGGQVGGFGCGLIADVLENHISTPDVSARASVMILLLRAIPTMWGEGVELGVHGAGGEVLSLLEGAHIRMVLADLDVNLEETDPRQAGLPLDVALLVL